MSARYFVAYCRQCDIEMPPFDSAAERDNWAEWHATDGHTVELKEIFK